MTNIQQGIPYCVLNAQGGQPREIPEKQIFSRVMSTPSSYVEVLTPVTQNVAVLGDGVSKEAIRMNWGHWGVLIRRDWTQTTQREDM